MAAIALRRTRLASRRGGNAGCRLSLENGTYAQAMYDAGWHERESFAGQDLRQATLDGRHFKMCNFSGADLRGSSLRSASFDCCNLRGADLRGAD